MSSPLADEWLLGGTALQSRLLLGTAMYASPQQAADCLSASGAQVATVAVRRINLKEAGYSLLGHPGFKGVHWLPNTAGCYTAREAVLTAELAQEALGTNWIKVEVIGDERTLLPEPVELLEACRQLVALGFVVLPYCSDDPMLCRRLADLGCAAVMPLAAPIGSGLGIRNPHNLELIVGMLPHLPVIVDAGIGTASDAALAMELGCTAVLLNTAVAQAAQPEIMAQAMGLAVSAGRMAHLAGRIPKLHAGAQASTSTAGQIQIL